MQTTFALVALAAVAYAAPQGVTENITPSAPAPAGCSTDFSGKFEIQAVNNTFTKRSIEKRAECGGEGTLVLTLAGGRLTDAKARTGYIASNYQFQFDAPPQTPSIYTGGFSSCSNGSLALGGSAVFYQCLSGGFYNLYDRSWAPQCSPILLQVLPCGGATAVSSPVSQIGDGQPQGPSAVPLSELPDGQPQVPTAKPVAPISQIGDGQIQATSAAAPISQISDGQVQAQPTKTPVSQISDGQIQVQPTKTPVSQISDGQVQVQPTKAPISQISDGQIQVQPTKTPVSQISDGQIQIVPSQTASSSQFVSNVTSTPVAFTGHGTRATFSISIISSCLILVMCLAL